MTAPSVLQVIFAARRAVEGGTAVQLAADAAQLERLAQVYGLVAVVKLEADMTVRPWRGKKGLKLAGRLAAEVVQECVVTLDPVTNRIEAEFSRHYLTETDADSKEIVIDPAANDPPEAWNGREIDLGAVVEEEFVLNIDPYPRKT